MTHEMSLPRYGKVWRQNCPNFRRIETAPPPFTQVTSLLLLTTGCTNWLNPLPGKQTPMHSAFGVILLLSRDVLLYVCMRTGTQEPT